MNCNNLRFLSFFRKFFMSFLLFTVSFCVNPMDYGAGFGSHLGMNGGGGSGFNLDRAMQFKLYREMGAQKNVAEHAEEEFKDIDFLHEKNRDYEAQERALSDEYDASWSNAEKRGWEKKLDHVKDKRSLCARRLADKSFAIRWPMMSATTTAVNNGIMLGVEAAVAEIIVNRFFKNVPEWLISCGRLAKRSWERIIYGTETLSWNYLAALNNKSYRTIKPLVVQTAGTVLAREKRLRILDDEEEVEVDEEWKLLALTTKKELEMIISALEESLPCYVNKLNGESPRIKKMARGLSDKFSLTRCKEIVAYVEILVEYLNTVINSCESAKSFEQLNKEHVKRLLIRICDTFEHLGFLIDEKVATTTVKKGYIKFLKPGLQDQQRFDSSSSMFGGSSMFGSGA